LISRTRNITILFVQPSADPTNLQESGYLYIFFVDVLKTNCAIKYQNFVPHTFLTNTTNIITYPFVFFYNLLAGISARVLMPVLKHIQKQRKPKDQNTQLLLVENLCSIF